MSKIIPAKAFIARPNQIPLQCKNKSGSTTAVGDWACFDAANTDEDTMAVKTPFISGRSMSPPTAILIQVMGVWQEAVPDGAVGLMIVGGYIHEAKVLGHASIAIGTPLMLVDGQVYATYDATADQTIIALEAYTTASVALKKVFLRNRLF